jgi:hypothetical protein
MSIPNEDNMQFEDNDREQTEPRIDHIAPEDMERLVDSDDDYRLSRQLPEGTQDNDDDADVPANEGESLTDGNTDISATEIALLESAEQDLSSDESRFSAAPDDTDLDGEPLNEGSGDTPFDTGEDLDIPADMANPDIVQEDEET